MSTKSPSESAEKADSQPILVAVSEENLAALLRATARSAEPEVQRIVEHAEAAAPVTGADDTSVAAPPLTPASCPEPATSPAVEEAESRIALLAAVREHRSAILRSQMTLPPPTLDLPPAGKADTTQAHKQYENPSASLPLKVVPLQATLPKAKPLMPAPTASIATPSRIAICGEQSLDTSRNRLVLGLIICAVMAVVGVSAFLIRAHSSKSPKAAVSTPKNSNPLHVQVEPPPSSQPPPAVTNIASPLIANGQSPARKVENTPIPSKDADTLRPALTKEAPHNRPPAPRVFTAPPLSSGRPTQVPTITFDQPPIVTSATTLPTMLGPSTTLNNIPAPAANQPPTSGEPNKEGRTPLPADRHVGPHRRNCAIHGPYRQGRYRQEFAIDQR